MRIYTHVIIMNFNKYRLDRGEGRAVLASSLPLAAAHAADIAMFLTDMAIVGRVGISELAGVAIAEQIVFLIISVLGTILSFASVLVANAIGSGDQIKSVHILQQGFYIALALSMPATLFAWNIGHILSLIGMDEGVITHATAYSRTVTWCIFPYLIFILSRSFLIAINNSNAVMKVTAFAIFFNAALSYALTFGLFGLSGFGVAGTGMATSIVAMLMAIFLGISIKVHLSSLGIHLFKQLPNVDFTIWSKVFRKGIPSAGATILEDSLFVVTAIVIGSFGVIALSAHYVVNSLVNIGNVLANGIGDATSIRVAINSGCKNLAKVRSACYSGVLFCGFITSLFAVAMLTAPRPLAQIFMDPHHSNGNEVMQLALQLFAVAALSQIFEGVQIVIMRALRGLEDTWAPFLIAICGYWAIAFPVGLILGNFSDLGVIGLWIGLTCGFASTTIALLWRFNLLTSRNT